MKKIYITGIPLDSNFLIEKKKFAPQNFQCDAEVSESYYPIIPIMESTIKENDNVKVILMRQSNNKGEHNLNIFLDELRNISGNAEIVDIYEEETQTNETIMHLFKEMTMVLEDDADYYIDMTFGPKTYTAILFSLFSYINNIKRDADIKGIYYQEVIRTKGKTSDANIYEVSILNDFNKFMCSISSMPQKNKEKTMELLLVENQ